MREVEESVFKQFYARFGGDVWIVQWSPFDNVIVYVDFAVGSYFRVSYEMNKETETLSFGESFMVKPRFLTDDEINVLFPANFTQQGATENEENNEELGTQQNQEGAFSTNESAENGGLGEQNAEKTAETNTEKENFSTSSLTDSEREELDALRKEVSEYRTIKKLELIAQFNEDLSKEFIAKITKGGEVKKLCMRNRKDKTNSWRILE